MTNLYIHIGAPKTGTTAIQQYLLRNREHLTRQGVLYPTGGLLKSAHHLMGAAIFPGRGNRLGDVTRDEALRTAVTAIRREMEEQKPHTVILSTEYLWGELSAANIQRLLQPFSDCSTKIIVYLRRQDLLAQSLYVQAIKGGLTDPFPVWIARVAESEKAGFDFYKVLSCWKNAGPKVEIVVRIYEKSQLSDDICLDFLKTVCPAIVLPPVKPTHANTGPDHATVELLRLISSKIVDPLLGDIVRRRILSNSPARPAFSPLNYLSRDEAIVFMEKFAEQNGKVAREFLGRSDGVLFTDSGPTMTSEGTAGIGPQFILDRLVDLLPVLLAEQNGGRTETNTARIQPLKKGSAKRIGMGYL